MRVKILKGVLLSLQLVAFFSFFYFAFFKGLDRETFEYRFSFSSIFAIATLVCLIDYLLNQENKKWNLISMLVFGLAFFISLF